MGLSSCAIGYFHVWLAARERKGDCMAYVKHWYLLSSATYSFTMVSVD